MYLKVNLTRKIMDVLIIQGHDGAKEVLVSLGLMKSFEKILELKVQTSFKTYQYKLQVFRIT